MSNLTTALRIGTTGMQLSQLALSTVSHNVVNANTVGFTRQIVQTSSVSVGGNGIGVQLDDIQRITDRFLTERVLVAISDTSFATTRRSYLESIESLFSGSGAGLDDVVGGFINAMAELSNDPTNTALRRNTVQQAALVAETLRNNNTSLRSTAINADNAINSEISTVNQIIKDIAGLNGQIAAIVSGASGAGANANDLMDQRDLKISALAERFNLQVSTNSTTGAVRISTENGRKLVDESSYSQLTRTVGSGDFQGIGVQNVRVDGTLSPTVFPINTDTLTSGKFKALIDVRDEVVPALVAQLDEFAATFSAEVNRLSSQGSSYPPAASLTSGSTMNLANTGSDIYADLSPSLAGSSFHISVVDSQGDPILTTVGGTSIQLPAAGPFSLTDLAALINADPTVANALLGGTDGVTAVADTVNGRPVLTIQTANSNYRVILSNDAGADVLGTLGMNNLFTGNNSNNIAVRADILANPDKIPTARMRATDGGLSSQDNSNILQLAKLADKSLPFQAAGGLGSQTVTAVGFTGQILSNLAVTVSDAKGRENFTQSIGLQLQQLSSAISGVNINEELSQMIIYQNSFQASSRIITVTSQLLEELMRLI